MDTRAPATQPDRHAERWLPTWAASMQPAAPGYAGATGLVNQTLRMVVCPHLDGDGLRLRLSNRFGAQPLTIDALHIARSDGGARVIARSDQCVTFAGSHGATLAPGGQLTSDALNMRVQRDQPLAVTLYVRDPSGPPTWHMLAQQTSFVATGNACADVGAECFTPWVPSWLCLNAVETRPARTCRGVIVAVGDSITDGAASTMDANRRWPDLLVRRLTGATRPASWAIVNAGISGNEVLSDCPGGGLALRQRLDADVLAWTQLRHVVFLAGINDIIHHPCTTPGAIIGGIERIIARVHAVGAHIHGGTLLPFGGHSAFSPERESVRRAVNAWIRTRSGFDSVIDFDHALRDPRAPAWLEARWHAGDHLHPNDVGCERIAAAIDLAIFGDLTRAAQSTLSHPFTEAHPC